MRLKDRVAFVTGAASGLGRAIAMRYAAEGAKVAVADLNAEQAELTANGIAELGGQAIGVGVDVSDEDQVNAAVERTVDTFGTVDVLVSNAGIQIVKPVEAFTLAEWRKMLAVHLDGAFLTTRACLPHMYRQKRGSIIYMGSAHAKEASKLKAPYVTAKHGLLGLCRVVAKEGAEHGVRANVICPGYVRTPLVDKQIPEQARALGLSEEEVVRTIMLGNTVDGVFTTEEDIAELALLFAAFKTNALTGQSLLASHGWFME
ncbi:3-hydroxybutyrate dehydrogenase [Paludibacterium purpuratum]|uniref:3-hydroxybutyrate dehydrogenase n=1 Tax=Paludibacterium purpuratum TaxID=1144873 RepID=A0A4R7BES1_9NEIS|nr:3-hydroxybutyrate dehydrogenase [Paludibacterium purpuratum]TDR82256.1 3-hydroxybutyrate dehydrogenase [Paludibacterium purpuratum]